MVIALALSGCCGAAAPRTVLAATAPAPPAPDGPLLISYWDDIVTDMHVGMRLQTVGQSRYTLAGLLGIVSVSVDRVVAAQVRAVLMRDRLNFDIAYVLEGDSEGPVVRRPWTFVASGLPDELPPEYREGARRSVAILDEEYGVSPGTRVAVGTRRYLGEAGTAEVATEYRIPVRSAGPQCLVWIDGKPRRPELLVE